MDKLKRSAAACLLAVCIAGTTWLPWWYVRWLANMWIDHCGPDAASRWALLGSLAAVPAAVGYLAFWTVAGLLWAARAVEHAVLKQPHELGWLAIITLAWAPVWLLAMPFYICPIVGLVSFFKLHGPESK